MEVARRCDHGSPGLSAAWQEHGYFPYFSICCYHVMSQSVSPLVFYSVVELGRYHSFAPTRRLVIHARLGDWP